MKKTTKIASLLCLALLLVSLPLISACGDDDEDDQVEKRKEIVIAVIGDLSGPSAANFATQFDCIRKGIRYINEVEGGIDGAKITFRWADDQLQVAKSVSGYKRIVAKEPKPAFIVFQMAAAAMAVKEDAERDQIPILTWGTAPALVDPPGWVFTIGPALEDQFAALADYILDNWAEDRPPRIAHMGSDDAYGRAAFAAFPYAEEKGVEIHTEFISPMPIDTTPKLLRIRDWGADFIYVAGNFVPVAVVLRDADRLGMLDEVQFLTCFWVSPYRLMELAGSAADGALTLHFMQFYALLLERGVDLPPGYFQDKEMSEYTRGKFDPRSDDHYYIMSRLFAAILEGAAAEVGMENVDGAAVYNLLDSGFSWDTQRGTAPFEWKPGKRAGMHSTIIYEMRGGELAPLTEAFEAPHIFEP